ncbi:unnamed protein product [Staurois parvus]|uniref:Uncharacterized protein n=1 Tax=Staurois parvus TaxID=386267 RepID=A0ABN9AQT7_9NEOB|nr:unnamed protein product [Staurois parvus]
MTKRLRTQYRRLPETADKVQELTRDCGHSTGDYQRQRTKYTGDDQRLRTQYRRLPETADKVQEMTRDCLHSTGDDQRLRT